MDPAKAGFGLLKEWSLRGEAVVQRAGQTNWLKDPNPSSLLTYPGSPPARQISPVARLGCSPLGRGAVRPAAAPMGR